MLTLTLEEAVEVLRNPLDLGVAGVVRPDQIVPDMRPVPRRTGCWWVVVPDLRRRRPGADSEDSSPSDATSAVNSCSVVPTASVSGSATSVL